MIFQISKKSPLQGSLNVRLSACNSFSNLPRALPWAFKSQAFSLNTGIRYKFQAFSLNTGIRYKFQAFSLSTDIRSKSQAFSRNTGIRYKFQAFSLSTDIRSKSQAFSLSKIFRSNVHLYIFNSITLILLLFLLIGLTSCNYHFGYGDFSSQYRTISIPYIENDKDGSLTTEVIRKINTSGAYQYVPYGGDLVLQIKLIELHNENVGFRYERKKDGCLKKDLIPTETRFIAKAEVQLSTACSNKVLLGPTIISANVDFDHEYYGSNNSVNIFSLGQLTDIDTAQDTAIPPLNKALAENISDYIINSW